MPAGAGCRRERLVDRRQHVEGSRARGSPGRVVTEMVPVTTPAGMTMSTSIAETIDQLASGSVVEPTLTALAAPRLVPLTLTVSPTRPTLGVNPVIFGVGMKALAVETFPATVVTLISPSVALAGTVTLSEFAASETTGALAPLKLTFVTLPRPLPEMVTVVPATPALGVKPVIFGVTRKDPLVAVVPPAFVAAIFPDNAPFGIVSVSVEYEFTVKLALTPPTETAVVPGERLPREVQHRAGGSLGRVQRLVDRRQHLECRCARQCPGQGRDRDGAGQSARGTLVVIELPSAAIERIGALTPLNLTALEPMSWEPRICTCWPTFARGRRSR